MHNQLPYNVKPRKARDAGKGTKERNAVRIMQKLLEIQVRNGGYTMCLLSVVKVFLGGGLFVFC